MISALEEKAYKDEIGRWVKEAYLKCGQRIGVLKGKYLVRVLPKETMSPSGRIVLADMDGPGKQNKPVYEAVVLEVYKRYCRDEWRRNLYKQTDVEPDWVTVRTWFEPIVEVGDHIMFQHWVGVPVPPLDLGIGDYRVIPEQEIICKVEYEKKKVADELVGIVWSSGIDTTNHHDEETPKALVAAILERYNVVSKYVEAKTLSGK
jgi:hypothetical protein